MVKPRSSVFLRKILDGTDQDVITQEEFNTVNLKVLGT